MRPGRGVFLGVDNKACMAMRDGALLRNVQRGATFLKLTPGWLKTSQISIRTT